MLGACTYLTSIPVLTVVGILAVMVARAFTELLLLSANGGIKPKAEGPLMLAILAYQPAVG